MQRNGNRARTAKSAAKKVSTRETVIDTVVADQKAQEKPVNFFLGLLHPRSGISSRRFIALIMTVHFVVTSYYALFTRTTIANLEVQMFILEWEAWIILSGFGFIALGDLGTAFIKRAEAFVVRAKKGEPDTVVGEQNVETIETQNVNTDGNNKKTDNFRESGEQ